MRIVERFVVGSGAAEQDRNRSGEGCTEAEDDGVAKGKRREIAMAVSAGEQL